MLPNLDEGISIILEHVRIPEAVEKPLVSCLGQTTPENVYADFDLPRTDIAGRDGYAVRSEDLLPAAPDRPVILRVDAVARAGRPSHRVVQPGRAIRIMTGSVIPRGADCVVRFEDTDEPAGKNGSGGNDPPQTKIFTAALPGDNIWPAGSHIRKGNLLLAKGCGIGPVQISALASMGKTRAAVIRRPKVAIIATGDELVRPGARLRQGHTYSGSGAMIAALVNYYGGLPVMMGIARDKESDLIAKMKKGMKADAIITIGGVSRGDYDLVRPAVAKIGKIVLDGVRMFPGTTAVFSMARRAAANRNERVIPVFLLAGPPRGCLINFETLVRPALLRMLGVADVALRVIEATALAAFRNARPMDVATFAQLQVEDGRYRVNPDIMDENGIQASLAAANAIAIIPGDSAIRAGDGIDVLPLDWRYDQKLI